MTNNSHARESTDARDGMRSRPTRAAIAAALNFYAGTRHRPPDDPGNETAPVATEAADTTETYTAKHIAKIPQAQGVSHSLMLARVMPQTYAALLENSATLAQLAQVLPVTAAAISGVMR